MSKGKVVGGVVLGVVVVAAICCIIYLLNENEELTEEVNSQKKKVHTSPEILNIGEVPTNIRKDFQNIATHIHSPKSQLSYTEALERIEYMKMVIENRDGYKIFYRNGECIKREKDLHILYDMACCKTICDVNKEVNNGRGPVDFTISYGLDKTLVEFKLASNTKLRMNLCKQMEVYAKANHNPHKIVVIFYFTEKELLRVTSLLDKIKITNKKIVLVDARRDNKISGSKCELDSSLIEQFVMN